MIDACFYVYVIFRKNGEPFYVGKGKRHRWREHIRAVARNGSGKNEHKDRIIASMLNEGCEPPVVKIAVGLTEAQAFEVERAFISALGRCPRGPLVNMTDGGEGPSGRKLSDTHRNAFTRKGQRHTPETIEKLRQIARERKPTRLGMRNSDEHNAAIAVASKGNKNCLDRTYSTETRAKLSASLRGRMPAESTIAAVRKANTGRSPSAETRAKLSAASMGRPGPKGTKWSEDRRAAMSARMKGNQLTKGRSLSPEQISKRTETRRANTRKSTNRG